MPGIEGPQRAAQRSAHCFALVTSSSAPLLRAGVQPEVWAGKKYDEACDIWSLGTVVFELAALEPPFQGQSLMQLRRAVAAGRYPQLPSAYSSALSRILSQMIVVDPTRRLRAVDILEHDEVKRRRGSRELSHPAAAPEEVDDTELLATIKPPKSKYEVKQLSEKLSAMSAQVATARSDRTDLGGAAANARPAAKPSSLGSLAEDAALPPSRYAAAPAPSYQAPAPSFQAPAPSYQPPANYQALAPSYQAPAPRYQQLAAESEPPLPSGWKKVRPASAAKNRLH